MQYQTSSKQHRAERVGLKRTAYLFLLANDLYHIYRCCQRISSPCYPRHQHSELLVSFLLLLHLLSPSPELVGGIINLLVQLKYREKLIIQWALW